MIHLLAKDLYRDFQFQILTILLQVQQTVECKVDVRLTFFCYNKKN